MSFEALCIIFEIVITKIEKMIPNVYSNQTRLRLTSGSLKDLNLADLILTRATEDSSFLKLDDNLSLEFRVPFE